MFFHQRFVPGLAIASYIVGDDKTKRAAVIDPTRDVEAYIERAEREGLRITDVLETHVHADFVSGARELKARLGESDVTIHCSGEGGDAWTPTYADRVVHDGDAVALGDVRLEARHTPGHTPEHLSWAVYDGARSAVEPWLLLTGDFLFVGDVGRPDLLGPDAQRQLARELYQSVFDRLEVLPDYVEIHPAHGAGSLCGKALSSRLTSTLGYEKRHNPALQWAGESQWIDQLMSGMPPAPPYFKRMKRMNQEGPPVLGAHRPGEADLTPQQLNDAIAQGAAVLDVRSKESFAAGHVPGSIHIELADNLATWAGWVMPYDRPIVLVLDKPQDETAQRQEVVTQLIRIGLDDVQGALAGGIDAWETAGLPLAHLGTVSAPDLAARLQTPSAAPPAVLDVRTDGEWQRGHIEGAIHVHLGQLLEHLDQIPAEREIAVVCGSGYRASIGASLLKRAGYESVTNVLGGMTAWQRANLPTTTPRAEAA